MKVQRVRIPNSDRVTWTILGDDYLPIRPVEQFIGYLESIERSPNTVRSYAYHLRLYWEHLGDTNKDWSKIEVTDLAEFVAWLRNPQSSVAVMREQQSKRTEASVNAIVTSICMLYDYQERLGVVKGIPLYNSQMQPGRRYKSFLHHINKSKLLRTKLIKLKEPRRVEMNHHERNVEGLRQNAQKKRQEAISRTEEGIKQLVKEGRSVNFKTVAEVADVSTAWLYKESEIKTRIEYLREQGGDKKKSVHAQQKATEASKDAKYQALKQGLEQVEAENRGLRDHLEAIHGRQRVLVDENETQCREIERLTKLLNEANAEIEIFKQRML